MRLPWVAVAGATLAVALGCAGLIRGEIAQSAPGGGSAPSSASPIVVTGAYIRAPVPPTDAAAAYFTVHNTSGTADRLERVITGAGASAELHVESDGRMAASTNGTAIPAHGILVLSTGHGHVMIEHLFGTVTAGQNVNIELDFHNAGPINVVAPVIAVGAPAPTASVAPAPTPSGQSS